jgi:hypothetical protein
MGGENVDVAALALHAHIIEMGDGVQELLSRSCVNPAMPLLRSMFEAFVQLKFIMTEDYRERSLQWFVCYLHRRLHTLEKFDPDLEKGKELQRLLTKEKTPIGFSSIDIEKNRDVMKSLKHVLTVETVAPIESHYQEIKKDKRNRNKDTFYELFHGLTLRGLSEAVGYGSYGAVLYRHWTHVAHAGDLHRFLTSKDGRGAFYRLRNPRYYKDVADVAVHIVILTTRMMLDHFRSGENVETWYSETFKPLRAGFDSFQVVFEDAP